MTGVLKMQFIRGKSNEDKRHIQECEEILKSIRDIRIKLRCANDSLNNVTEPYLIETCIYEINAINSQYSHLIRRAKMLGVVEPRILRSRSYLDV